MSEDGWIPHDGNECPVGDHTIVQIKIRDGLVSAPERAGSWGWRDIGRSKPHRHDIIAYRIVENGNG